MIYQSKEQRIDYLDWEAEFLSEENIINGMSVREAVDYLKVIDLIELEDNKGYEIRDGKGNLFAIIPPSLHYTGIDLKRLSHLLAMAFSNLLIDMIGDSLIDSFTNWEEVDKRVIEVYGDDFI